MQLDDEIILKYYIDTDNTVFYQEYRTLLFSSSV